MTQNASVLRVPAVVRAVSAMVTLRQRRLVALALDVVQPDPTLARPVGAAGNRLAPAVAQGAAHHGGVVVVPVVVAHRAPGVGAGDVHLHASLVTSAASVCADQLDASDGCEGRNRERHQLDASDAWEGRERVREREREREQLDASDGCKGKWNKEGQFTS